MEVRVNTDKTETMCFGLEPDFFIESKTLGNVIRLK